ncbi:MAG TPA: chemotaxis protein CheW [Vicinamibacterales bacterium]|nr:chemotaxis protein CheW [Vicinamibacterales bacterium]
MSETFILFTVAGTTYAVRSREVAHVEMVEQVTPVPDAPPFVDGVVFSRGQVVPALNLRARFGFERAPYDVRTRLLVVQSEGRSVGLVVDAAREFIRLDGAQIQPPGTALTDLSGRYLEGVANLDDRLILVLSLSHVLNFVDPVVAD